MFRLDMQSLRILAVAAVWFVFACFMVGALNAQTVPTVRSVRPLDGLQQSPPQSFVLTGARVVVEPGRVLESTDIAIDHGLIRQVGAQLSPAPGARVIDCRGKTIYAGLIDAYSEQSIEAQLSQTGHWSSNVRPQVRAADYYQADRTRNDQYRRSGFVARLVAPTQGQIKGVSAIVSTSDAASPQATLLEQVGLHVTVTLERFGRTFPGSPMGALTLVRQTLYDVDWYDAAWRAAQADSRLPRPEINEALNTIKRLRDQNVPLIIDASNELFFLRADAIAREFSWRAIIHGSGREYRRLNDIAATGRPVIVPLQFPKAPDVSTPEAARTATLERLMHWDLAPENPSALHNAGVQIAFTTHGLEGLKETLGAVRTAVQRGLDPDAALRALTLTPAKMFGIDDRLGTLEAGKLASLIVVDGDLFDRRGKIVETWVEGVRFELDKQPQDLRGDWKVQIEDAESTLAEGLLSLRGSPKRLSGTIKLKDHEIKLASVLAADRKLSCDFSTKEIELPGIARLTIVIDHEDLSDHVFVGTWHWATGKSAAIRATWQPTPKETEGKKRPDRGDKTDSADEGEPSTEVKEAQTETVSEEVSKEAAEEPADVKPDAVPPEAVDDAQPPAEVAETPEVTPDPSAGEAADVPGIDGDYPAEPKTEAGPARDAPDGDAAEPSSYPVNFPLGVYGFETPPEQPECVVFTGATVWTAGPEGTLQPASVVVESGRIVEVGREVTIPDGARVVDVSGKHISPGIIDCHSHIATDGGLNESTQAVTAEVRISDFIDPNDISIYRQLAGGTTSANVLHGSANPIGGQNQVIKLRWGGGPDELKFQGAPAGIKFALGENVKQSNWGDDQRTRYPQTRMGVDEIIVDAFERARAYRAAQQNWISSRRGLPPRMDLELEALVEVLEGKRWIHCHSYRQSEILALMKTCDRFGVTIGTFQHILEGYKLADEMARRGIMASAFADWWAYKFEVYDAIPYAAALMHQAGVVVSLNSDDAELGRHLNIDAAKAMKYGDVPAEEALKFVTLNPARQLRIDDRVGSIEPGKDADLVVWSHSPLSIYAVCEQTWIDGRQYFSRELERQLRERDAERHTGLVQKILASKSRQLRADEDDKSEGTLWPREDIFCHGHDHEHGHD